MFFSNPSVDTLTGSPNLSGGEIINKTPRILIAAMKKANLRKNINLE